MVVTGVLRCARTRNLRRGNARRTAYLDYTNPLPDSETWWVEADRSYRLASGRLPRWMDPSSEGTVVTVRVTLTGEVDGVVVCSRITQVA